MDSCSSRRGRRCTAPGWWLATLAGALVAHGQELLRDRDLELSRPDGSFPGSGAWQAAWLGEAGAICVGDLGRSGNALFLYTGAPTNDLWSAPFQDHPASPGQAFRASAWMRNPPGQAWQAGSSARVHVAFLNAEGNVLTSFESPALSDAGTDWHPKELITELAPPETATVRFMCILEKPRRVQGLSVAVFDDASLQRAEVHSVELASRAVGVPADVSSTSFIIRNTGNLPLAWRLEETAPWLSLEPTQGTLSVGSVQVVNLSVNRTGREQERVLKDVFTLVSDAGSHPVRVYAAMPGPPVPEAPALVRVHGRQLVVRDRRPDGSLAPPVHYLIKGAAWSPSSRETPDVFTARRAEFVRWYVADVELLREMNANTVYTFLDFGTDEAGRRVLDYLYRAGLKAVVTVDEKGTGTTNRLVQVVTAYRRHPAVLAWSLGNEWNINLYHKRFPQTPEGYRAAAAFTESMARLVKSLDGDHPVMSTHGDIYPPEMSELANSLAPSVDAWGLNVYRGPSFTTLFGDWAALTPKPMFLSEYGTDAYRSLMLKTDVDLVSVDGVVDLTTQAGFNRGLWREIAANLSATRLTNVCLGGTVFAWNDEWWKAQGTFGGRVGRHDNLGFYTSWNPESHPDSVANEEWFALVSVDREPRPTYFDFQQDFAAVVPGEDLDGDGLPDAWEYPIVEAAAADAINHITEVRGADDFDLDGAANRDEFDAGTDPTDAASGFRVLLADPPTLALVLRWRAAPGRSYGVESSPTLVPAQWQPETGAVQIKGEEASFVVPEPEGSAARFYRVTVAR